MQKDSAQAKISLKVVGGYFFWLILYVSDSFEDYIGQILSGRDMCFKFLTKVSLIARQATIIAV